MCVLDVPQLSLCYVMCVECLVHEYCVLVWYSFLCFLLAGWSDIVRDSVYRHLVAGYSV